MKLHCNFSKPRKFRYLERGEFLKVAAESRSCLIQGIPRFTRDDMFRGYNVILNSVKDLQMQAFQEISHPVRDDVSRTY